MNAIHVTLKKGSGVMKPNLRFYLFVSIVLMFLFGCSSTYKLTDYNSKEGFYKDVNSSIKNRDVNVVTFDSSFISSAGSRIKDDSLQTVARIKEEKIALRDVKDIKYFGRVYEAASAYVWLQSNKELRAETFKKLPDSMIKLTNIRLNSGNIPIDKVKEITYKTRWQSTLIGAPTGFASGTVLGGILGATGIMFRSENGGNHPKFDPGTSMIAGAIGGALIGTITGAIVGYIVGWDHIYQFDP